MIRFRSRIDIFRMIDFINSSKSLNFTFSFFEKLRFPIILYSQRIIKSLYEPPRRLLGSQFTGGPKSAVCRPRTRFSKFLFSFNSSQRFTGSSSTPEASGGVWDIFIWRLWKKKRASPSLKWLSTEILQFPDSINVLFELLRKFDVE